MEEDSWTWEGAGKHETELEQSGEQGTRSGSVAEYRRRPVLRQELKGKEEERSIVSDGIVAHEMYFSAIYRLRWYRKAFLIYGASNNGEMANANLNTHTAVACLPGVS